MRSNSASKSNAGWFPLGFRGLRERDVLLMSVGDGSADETIVSSKPSTPTISIANKWPNAMNSSSSMFKGRHFDQEIIVLCVRWYLRFKLSSRDLVQMMAQRGIALTHTTILRWVQRYVPEFKKRWNTYSGRWVDHGVVMRPI
jgi:hypothetical protein